MPSPDDKNHSLIKVGQTLEYEPPEFLVPGRAQLDGDDRLESGKEGDDSKGAGKRSSGKEGDEEGDEGDNKHNERDGGAQQPAPVFKLKQRGPGSSSTSDPSSPKDDPQLKTGSGSADRRPRRLTTTATATRTLCVL